MKRYEIMIREYVKQQEDKFSLHEIKRNLEKSMENYFELFAPRSENMLRARKKDDSLPFLIFVEMYAEDKENLGILTIENNIKKIVNRMKEEKEKEQESKYLPDYKLNLLLESIKNELEAIESETIITVRISRTSGDIITVSREKMDITD